MNRAIKVWSGDPAWPRGDFRLVFDGVIADMGSAGRESVNLVLRDKLQRLNTPITEAKLGGASPNKDAILPIPFGECHNVTPLLTNPATLEYGFLGAVESMFRSTQQRQADRRGLHDDEAGRFRLTTDPFSTTITASVQGDKGDGYAPRIAPLVQRIATAYGKAADRFTAGRPGPGQPGRIRYRPPANGGPVCRGPYEPGAGHPATGGQRGRAGDHVAHRPAAPGADRAAGHRRAGRRGAGADERAQPARGAAPAGGRPP